MTREGSSYVAETQRKQANPPAAEGESRLSGANSLAKALTIWELVQAKKGRDCVVLDLRALTVVCDYFLIAHGTSDRHIQGLVDELVRELRSAGLRPFGVEGYRHARWVLLDYGDVVVHVFAEEEREVYNLERLWGDAPRVAIEDASAHRPLTSARTTPEGREGHGDERESEEGAEP